MRADIPVVKGTTFLIQRNSQQTQQKTVSHLSELDRVQHQQHTRSLDGKFSRPDFYHKHSGSFSYCKIHVYVAYQLRLGHKNTVKVFVQHASDCNEKDLVLGTMLILDHSKHLEVTNIKKAICCDIKNIPQMLFEFHSKTESRSRNF